VGATVAADAKPGAVERAVVGDAGDGDVVPQAVPVATTSATIWNTAVLRIVRIDGA
jgi:hypothetical protein